jgi:hypothetical protein
MIALSKSLIQKPDPSTALPGPHGNDMLSDAMQLFRVWGAALLRGEYTAPWAWDAPNAAVISERLHRGACRVVVFHIVAESDCWLEVEGFERMVLHQDDLVGFPHGHTHRARLRQLRVRRRVRGHHGCRLHQRASSAGRTVASRAAPSTPLRIQGTFGTAQGRGRL